MTDNKYCVHVDTAENARDIQSKISELIITYGCAAVSDLKDLMGLIPESSDDDFGWVNIPLVEIEPPLPDGTIIMNFPSPIPLGPKSDKKEAVDHPSHYQSEAGLEVRDVIEAFTSDLKGIEAFDTGNVLKYMCRWKSKNGLEDLKKAKRYIEHLIDHVEKLEKEND